MIALNYKNTTMKNIPEELNVFEFVGAAETALENASRIFGSYINVSSLTYNYLVHTNYTHVLNISTMGLVLFLSCVDLTALI